jgi:hypothetical protein
MLGTDRIPVLVIHTVHGTWPYGFVAHGTKRQRNAQHMEPPWFLNGSQFQSAITAKIRREHVWVPFEWSGRNSFFARRLAAKEFSQHLTEWFQREPEAEHVVVAHSHGGSVSVGAAHILDAQDGNSLSKIITLATPFALAKPSGGDIRELVARYMCLRFGWIAIGLFFLIMYLVKSDPAADPMPMVGVFALYSFAMLFALLILTVAWNIGIVKFRPPTYEEQFASVTHSWALYAVRAARDEATIAINASQFIDFASGVLFRRCLIFPFDWSYRHLMTGTRLKRIVIWGMISIVILIISFNGELSELLSRNYEPNLVDVIIVIPISLAVAMFLTALLISEIFLFGFSAIALFGSIILMVANAFLAAALGFDVITYRGLMELECEPSPSGITGILTTVTHSEDDRAKIGLVHFIHATEAARSRVSDILEANFPRT